MIKGDVTTDSTGIHLIDRVSKQRSITLKAVKSGIRIVSRAAKDEAPRRTGMLRKAQGWIAKKGRKGQTGSYAVQGARRSFRREVRLPGRTKPVKVVPANYEHLVRLGTKPHSMRSGSKLVRRAINLFRSIVGGHAHPGAKPNDFRRRAWGRTEDEAAKATLETMGVEVRKVLAEAAARTK